MTNPEAGNWGRLTKQYKMVIDKMEEITWRLVQGVDPDFAESYLAEFRTLPTDPTIFVKMQILQRKLSAHATFLATQDRIPNFIAIRNMAREELGLPPIRVNFP